MPESGGVLFTVCVSYATGRVRAETFAGDGARSRAEAFLARSAEGSGVAELRLTRTGADGVPELVGQSGPRPPGAAPWWQAGLAGSAR